MWGYHAARIRSKAQNSRRLSVKTLPAYAAATRWVYRPLLHDIVYMSVAVSCIYVSRICVTWRIIKRPWSFFWSKTCCLFSCVWLCQQSYCRHARVSRSLTQVSRKPLYGYRSNFTDNSLFTTSQGHFKTFFSNFLIFIFLRFFFVFVNREPYGSKNSKRYSYNFHLTWDKLYDK